MNELHGTGMILIESYNGKFYGVDEKDFKPRPIFVVHYDIDSGTVYYLKQSSSKKVLKLNNENYIYTIENGYKRKRKNTYILMTYLYKDTINKFDIKSTSTYNKNVDRFLKTFIDFKENKTGVYDEIYEEIRHLFVKNEKNEDGINNEKKSYPKLKIEEKNTNNINHFIEAVKEEKICMLKEGRVFVPYEKIIKYNNDYYINFDFNFFKLMDGYPEGSYFVQDHEYLWVSRSIPDYKKLLKIFFSQKSKNVSLLQRLEYYDSNRKTQDFIIIEKNHLYGIMDYSGNLIVEPIYHKISPYPINGYYIIQKDDKFGLMDKNCNLVLPCKHNFIDVETFIINNINNNKKEVS